MPTFEHVPCTVYGCIRDDLSIETDGPSIIRVNGACSPRLPRASFGRFH
jgi:hypothetical protein